MLQKRVIPNSTDKHETKNLPNAVKPFFIQRPLTAVHLFITGCPNINKFGLSDCDR